MNKKENLPGTGDYIAYYKSENKHFKSLEYRLPKSLIEDMQPDLDKIGKLFCEGQCLFIKSWKLANERCYTIIQEAPVMDAVKNAEYSYEQNRINLGLLEIDKKMSDLMYGQYRKGLKSGLIPEEVSKAMTGALIGYEELGVPAQDGIIGRARTRVEESRQALKKCKKITEKTDTVLECIKAHQKAYRSTRPISSIRSIKPFYDGTWYYNGDGLIEGKDYDYALMHRRMWVMASSKAQSLYGDSPETFEYMRNNIMKEYNL